MPEGGPANMTDTPDKPEDQVSGQPQPDEEERPPLREVSEDERKKILAAHKKWLASGGSVNVLGIVESKGKEGERADLSNANLQGAVLFNVDLQGANLFRARLQGANLHSANLQRAVLSKADLQGARLNGANLPGARLVDANLQGANLSGANLQEANLILANLHKAVLIRANLQGADLTAVKGLAEAYLREANLEGATGLLGTEFARVDVTRTRLPEDIREFQVLKVVEETSKNARKNFLAMLLGCAYAWLTVATTTDARLLTNSASSPLPIIGTEIPIAGFYWAAPFILMGLYVYLHFYLERLWQGLAGLPARFPDGKRLDERAYPWLLNGLVRRHFTLLKEGRPPIAHFEEWVTIFLAWWAVPATLFGFWLRYLPRHEWVGTGLHIGLLVVSVALATIFYRSAARTLRGDESQQFVWKTFWRQSIGFAFAGIVFLSLLSFGAIQGGPWAPLAIANLREADVSTKPANYWELSAEDRIKSVKGASLRGRSLRYANAFLAFLANADLRDANLQRADLRLANLQGADLSFANLQGADLRDAKGLTQEQLDWACGDKNTKLPDDLSEYKMRPCPKESK